jgi:transcriptional regulator with XRE-family HTH domain
MEMEMKTNAQIIKRLREEKSWSQEHLAEAAGLSLRTVQRVETDGNASAETRLALASTLGIDVSELSTSAGGEASTQGPPTPFHESKKAGFLRHGLIYVVVCTALVLMDWKQNGHLVWSFYPVLGWGFGLLLHGIKAVRLIDGSAKAGFLRHSVIYGVVCTALVVLDWKQNGRLVWSFYPILGWGLGLFFHGMKVVRISGDR